MTYSTGYVSIERAGKDYGVVIDGFGEERAMAEIDLEATDQTRNGGLCESVAKAHNVRRVAGLAGRQFGWSLMALLALVLASVLDIMVALVGRLLRHEFEFSAKQWVYRVFS